MRNEGSRVKPATLYHELCNVSEAGTKAPIRMGEFMNHRRCIDKCFRERDSSAVRVYKLQFNANYEITFAHLS